MDFFNKYKKIFLVILFLLVSILMGYIIYRLFFASIFIEEAPPTATSTTTGQLPIAGQGQPTTGGTSGGETTEPSLPRSQASEVAKGGLTKTTELTKNSTLDPSLSSNGTEVKYYNKEDGKFYRINKDGDVETLTDKVFYNVEKVTWSPSSEKAILEYPDGANIVYDFSSKQQVTLPSHWEDFDFSPSGDKIVMKSMGLDPDNRWLAVSNSDGSMVKTIEDLGEEDDSVYSSWSPNNQVVAMYTEGVDFNRQEVYFVGLNGENFKSTIIEGRGFDPSWSPEGTQLVYSVYSSDNSMKPELWAVDAQGENIGNNRHRLNVETWGSKCTFAGTDQMYCAVPDSLPEGAGLFPELAKTTTDKLYKINVASGQKKLVAVPDGSYNMSNLIVSNDGSNLFFTDASTERLYKIKLK